MNKDWMPKKKEIEETHDLLLKRLRAFQKDMQFLQVSYRDLN